MKSAAGAPADSGGFFVTIVEPGGQNTRKVEGTSLLIGRADDCGLTIAHETLSRRHMTISLKNGVCWIEDHASSNGTFINGKRIPSHHPMRVLPNDKITMGQAATKLSVTTQAPGIDASGLIDIGPGSMVSRIEPDVLEPKAKPQSAPREDAQALERAQLAASQKASALLQAAEVEAEKRVQEIYRRAHETQAKMEENYQRRTNEAYRASEQVYQKAQAEATALLETARQRAVEIRGQAEAFVQELRRKTEMDCERLLADAQKTSREVKDSRLAEVEEIVKKRQESSWHEAKQKMDERVASFERDMVAQAQAQKERLQLEERQRRENVERDLKHQVDQLHDLREEVEEMRERRAHEQLIFDKAERETQHRREEAEEYKRDAQAAQLAVVALNRELIELRTQIIETAQVSAESQAGLGRLTEEKRQAERRVAEAREKGDEELVTLRAQLEETKARLASQETVHLEELRLQSARQVAEMERQLFEELDAKRDTMTRELAFAIENLSKEQNPLDGRQVRQIVGAHLKEQIVSLGKSDAGKTKQVSLVALRRRQKFKAIAFGVVTGAILIFGGEHAVRELRGDESPMLSFVTNAAKEQAAELESRKFKPTQTSPYKDTYVNNVVYTENFSAQYASDDFQEKLRRQLTSYMLKTWKVEEDKVIELLGITSTLVKTLGEKRDAIHPDFVPQGLAKMKDDETEALGRMKTLLGSSVRVESFREFEKKFYSEYRPPLKDDAIPRAPSAATPRDQ